MTSQQEAQEINDTVKQVQSLNLTPDQEARDLDTIFMSQDLLTQAIQVLQKRIDASTNDPTLHRLLGDRYLQAGFPQKARPLYVKAKSLAQENANKAEQRLAQQGLEKTIQQQ
ncbi:hypothetical protein [Mastigocoleus testarum]|uniref:Tetratricopeptide repeat protein n=1 Tax=Mastigocoleus testarum BC008 TaxID=371196 RepID=A0A0V7ZVR2_9CYAN|nr:hypothetical protein [Mastigocoleus testarum]KST63558.1 hypothetical protein BC008_13925 [Mastigocoleus testarum BC008]KST68439.1 hypothetical protein BC008_00790 [Mastigocoleus testarum BC008]